MSELLSQAEIDALLSGESLAEDGNNNDTEDKQELELSSQEIDAIGEVGNISMGTASTALSTLLNQKVLITTPKVIVTTLEELISDKQGSCVAIKAEFTHGLQGSNLLILKEEDVKITADIMMGGNGSNIEGDITDLQLSAISEAMNQMIGSAATSMSSIMDEKIQVSPPKAFITTFDKNDFSDFNEKEKIVKVSFKMEIGDLINSEMQQLIPIDFAKKMVSRLSNVMGEEDSSKNSEDIEQEQTQDQMESMEQSAATVQQKVINVVQDSIPNDIPAFQSQPGGSNISNQVQQSPHNNHIHTTLNNSHQDTVNIKPVQFQSFEENITSSQKENIGLLMDIPLKVTVELGRTQKLIRDILEFAPGSIIELDKLAGEQVDILVNGKIIAKGEVVIIDESFGVRVTDIVQPSKRI